MPRLTFLTFVLHFMPNITEESIEKNVTWVSPFGNKVDTSGSICAALGEDHQPHAIADFRMEPRATVKHSIPSSGDVDGSRAICISDALHFYIYYVKCSSCTSMVAHGKCSLSGEKFNHAARHGEDQENSPSALRPRCSFGRSGQFCRAQIEQK